MSIGDARERTARLELQSAITRKEVEELQPWVGNQPPLRMVYVHSKLLSDLHNEDHAEADRLAEVRADLERFATDQYLPQNYLKALTPLESGIFEIKCDEPRPMVRVFGVLPLKDVFVAIEYAYRPFLGKLGSWAWRENLRYAKRVAGRLFSIELLNLRTRRRDEIWTNDDDYYD